MSRERLWTCRTKRVKKSLLLAQMQARTGPRHDDAAACARMQALCYFGLTLSKTLRYKS
jgi:hypothetical protein